MKHALTYFMLLGSLLLAPLGIAQSAPEGVAPQAPTLNAAVRVPHAVQAAMLATARAGGRIVAVGDHGVVLLSDDEGRTHRQAQQVPVDVTLTGVSFADAKNGWAVGHWGVVLHSQDGGETWTLQRSDTQQDRPLFAVHFFDAKQGVAVGLWSLVLVTADGGAHWLPVSPPAPEGARRADLNLLGLFADGQGRLYASAERGMVLRSDDRGLQWRYLSTGYAGSLWTGAATSDGTLLVAGLRGSLFRSSDSGKHWQRIDTHSKSSITALAAQGAHVFGVGLDGLLLRSDNAGATFTAEVRADRLPLTAIALGLLGRPLLYSRQGPLQQEAGSDKTGRAAP